MKLYPVKQVSIFVFFGQGRIAKVFSPENSRKGLLLRFGWLVMLCGMWIMFGRSKEFRTHMYG